MNLRSEFKKSEFKSKFKKYKFKKSKFKSEFKVNIKSKVNLGDARALYLL